MSARKQPDPEPYRWRRFQLTLAAWEQPVIALMVVLCMIGMIFYFAWQAFSSGGLIDIDTLPRRSVEYRVDINQANWPELANLPGIGETYAKAIVDYRNNHGPFDHVDQLTKIRGIGPVRLEKLQPFLLPIRRPSIAPTGGE